jgi:hypothetical protein
MKNILIILFTLINISNSHHFGGQIEISNADENDWKNRETNLYSQSREMAKCTCDLTSHCNIGCCCDEKCSEEDRKEWKDNSLCLDDYKKWVEDYMCKDGEETFKYNKEKAGINIKDHIFNIMCIKYDRSCDMVNYYVNYNEEEDKPKIEALKEYWITKFFGSSEVRRIEEVNTLKYGQNINKTLTLYKADSNGKCISTNSFFLIPFESSCYLDDDLDSINKDDIKGNYQEYGITSGYSRKISDITYIIYYNSSNLIDRIEAKVLYIDTISKSKQIKFKVQWKKKEEGKQTKNFPPGYLQGNPIKVSVNVTIYNYGYYFHIYSYDGECIDDKGKSFNPISILFKNNMFISCTYTKDPKTTLIYEIYKNIINDNLKFYSAPNATENIKIINKTDDDFTNNLNNIEGNNIKMHLIFLTTQKGKENSPYDIIQKVYLKMEYEKVDSQDTSPRKISLNVKFVDFSYSTIENSINNKITSSIPLPKKLLEKMSE